MLNFAIIGCGRIAPFHKEGIRETEGAVLKAVCDLNETKTTNFTVENVSVYNNYRDVLADPEIDVVNICTEHHLHSEIAIAAMEAGKHIIVEKPIALSMEEANRMLEAEKRTGVKATVVFQNRYNKPIELTRRALEDGRFGELSYGAASVRWYRGQDYYNQDLWRGKKYMKDGFLMNQSIHTIDLLLWMMGPVKKVIGQVKTSNLNIEMENIGVAILEFESGAIGMIEGVGASYPDDLEGRLSLVGQHGTVIVGGSATNRLEAWRFEKEYQDEQKYMMELDRKHNENAPTVYGYGHEKVIEDMVCAIKMNRSPKVRLEDGKNALQLILAIYESSENNGVPVWL
ncbi:MULTISPECIES: Gfo/Idh/MocA family protein [Bacillaceae]|uniref:Gfo/Idh/MocA family oxidoreductase n=1 Tax=Evansella alkalicola TaxID=745819 RepID=A0ABS6JSM9_9BACI|nr:MULTISPECIES: Gfo/Idh/MocA family oxidoreductase [Bacillaceae]MBU9721564.1 Gfo/Idh/MocA family oxidoreductase [Bacillus alkalicola]